MILKAAAHMINQKLKCDFISSFGVATKNINPVQPYPN